jgi:hypothetical protein
MEEKLYTEAGLAQAAGVPESVVTQLRHTQRLVPYQVNSAGAVYKEGSVDQVRQLAAIMRCPIVRRENVILETRQFIR